MAKCLNPQSGETAIMGQNGKTRRTYSINRRIRRTAKRRTLSAVRVTIHHGWLPDKGHGKAQSYYTQRLQTVIQTQDVPMSRPRDMLRSSMRTWDINGKER